MTSEKIKNPKKKGNDFMKKAIALALTFILSAALFSGCNKNENLKIDNQEANQANASTEVKNKELAGISLDSAIDIALKDAGVQRKDALFQGSPSLDKDDKKPHYDIEFRYNGVEYDYEVAVDNGSVIKAEKENVKDKVLSNEKVSETVNVKEEKKEPVKPTSPSVTNSDNRYISIEKAKEIALDNAGVKQADAVLKKAYYDSDDLVAHFDIKFVADGFEYEYEIKADNGAILEKDIEKESVRQPVSQAPAKEFISKEKAKEIAIAHAKIDSANAKFVKAELDTDDLIVHYEVEFVEGKYEYEYEINAESGKIIAHDKELND